MDRLARCNSSKNPFDLAALGAAVQALLGPWREQEGRGTLGALNAIDVLLSHCAANTANVPVLMMSGHVPEMTAAAARFPNIVAIIEKPFLSDALVSLVLRTLKAPAKKEQNRLNPRRRPSRQTRKFVFAYFISERRRESGLLGDARSDWLEAKQQLLPETGPR